MNIANAANKFAQNNQSSRARHEFSRPALDDFAHASRGFLKLMNIVQVFHYDFRGKTVLDIGSSTGGFTKVALLRGAAKVIAVEKGTNQMEAPLRFSPQIELHEKTDIFNVVTKSHQKFAKPNSLIIDDIDTIVADVSFLSLTKVLKYAKLKLARPTTDLLVMLKPQFEASPHQLHRGVVKNESIRRDIIKDFEFWLKQNGFLIIKKHDNALSGKTGNRERFYYLQLVK